MNLGRTLVDLFVWPGKSFSKNHLHRRTNRRTNSDDSVVRKFVRPGFTSVDLSVQTICSSSSVKTANEIKNLTCRKKPGQREIGHKAFYTSLSES